MFHVCAILEISFSGMTEFCSLEAVVMSPSRDKTSAHIRQRATWRTKCDSKSNHPQALHRCEHVLRGSLCSYSDYHQQRHFTQI